MPYFIRITDYDKLDKIEKHGLAPSKSAWLKGKSAIFLGSLEDLEYWARMFPEEGYGMGPMDLLVVVEIPLSWIDKTRKHQPNNKDEFLITRRIPPSQIRGLFMREGSKFIDLDGGDYGVLLTARQVRQQVLKSLSETVSRILGA